MKSKFVPPSIVQPQQERNESKTAFIKKLRSGIDKAFAQLLLNKDLSKAALLSHKQEVNRLLDENTFWLKDLLMIFVCLNEIKYKKYQRQRLV